MHQFGGKSLAKDKRNEYNSRSLPECTEQKHEQKYDEKLLDDKSGDRRLPSDDKMRRYFFSNVGQLRMQFGDKYYVGSGTVIALSPNNQYVILTCAHNLVDVDPIDNSIVYADNIWFKHKTDKGEILWSCTIQSGKVYPKYFKNSTSHSGDDLAVLLATPDADMTKDKLKKSGFLTQSDICLYEYSRISSYSQYWIGGYPAEKQGQLWHGSGHIEKVQSKDLVVYNEIDTTGGNSGSMIAHGGQYYGVHTGGSKLKGKNWGTCFSLDKLKWIATFVKIHHFQKNDDGHILCFFKQ